MLSCIKLKKAIQFPHMWRYDILKCEGIIFDSSFVFSLKLYLNPLVYEGPSSIIFRYLWLSLVIFSDLEKSLQNVWKCWCGLQTNFGKSRRYSESSQKSLENRHKCCFVLWIFCSIKKGISLAAWRYETYLLMLKSVSILKYFSTL